MNAFQAAFGKEAYEKKIFFQMGAPGSATLRDVAKLMKEATCRCFSNFDDGIEEYLQYGCTPGNPDFNNELAKFLSENYRNPVRSENLYTNTGSSQGFANLLSYYLQPGDTLFVGDPTYWILLDAIRSSGLNVVGIKVDEQGMLVDDLEKHMRNLKEKAVTERYPYRAGVYVLPVHQNPMTVCLSEERCRNIVALARKHDLLIISDDVYNVLTYSAPDCDDPTVAKPPVRLFHYDNESDPDYKGNVVSIGSFSKYLSPGLRLGWFEMPSKVLKDFSHTVVSLSANGRNPYTSAIVTEGLKSGLVQNQVRKVRSMYAERMKRAHEIIITSLQKYGVKCNLPKGGIFLWISLPEQTSAEDVLELCQEEMSFVPGRRCSISGSCKNGMRIAVSFYEPDVLYPAISRLCSYITQVLKKTIEVDVHK